MSEMPSKIGWDSTVASVFADDKELMDGLDPWYHHVTVEMMCACVLNGPWWYEVPDAGKKLGADPRDPGSYHANLRQWLLDYTKFKLNTEERPVGKIRYQCAGLIITAAMLQKVTGKDYCLLLKEKLFGRIIAHPELPINRWSCAINAMTQSNGPKQPQRCG